MWITVGPKTFFFSLFFQVFGFFDLESSKRRDKQCWLGEKTDEIYRLKAISISWSWKWLYHCDKFVTWLPRCLIQADNCIQDFWGILQNEIFFMQSLIRQKTCSVDRITPEQMKKIQSSNSCANCNKFLVFDDRIIHHCHIQGCLLGLICRRCNVLLKKNTTIPLFAHNFSKFDSKFVLESLDSPQARSRISDIKIYAKTAENVIRMDITFFCLCCFPEDILPKCPNYATLSGKRVEMKQEYEKEYRHMIKTIEKEISFQDRNIKEDYESDIIELSAEVDTSSHVDSTDEQPLVDIEDFSDFSSDSGSGSESEGDDDEMIHLDQLDGYVQTQDEVALVQELQKKVDRFKRHRLSAEERKGVSASDEQKIEYRHSISCSHKGAFQHRRVSLKDRYAFTPRKGGEM